MKLKYIVTGTGRCGTLYMANFLTSIDIACGHESVFMTEGSEKAKKIINGEIPPENSEISANIILKKNQEQIADSSYMAAPFLRKFNAKVIHIIRNPFEVVNSYPCPCFLIFVWLP